jgi:CRISPR system Cascade subunit CasC
MPARFIQLHYFTAYPASLLNRDDAGFAKRIPFGGAIRTRVSSQCLKRHWRAFDGEHALSQTGVPASVRSRLTFEHFVLRPLVESGVSESIALACTEALMAEVLGESAKAKAKKKKTGDESSEESSARTGQIVVLGRPEVDYLLTLARDVCASVSSESSVKAAINKVFGKETKENLAHLRHAAGLDAALFGRMVTSDILARGDAALHVAHAFTVHEEATESDYFSVVDDLQRELDDAALGSGHIGSAELTSGLYYGYVVVDVPLLISNLEGVEQDKWKAADRALAADIVGRLVHLVATVSPGAKKGSTAPYSYAHLVIAEAGDAQPRTFANAFLQPVRETPDVVQNMVRALSEHVVDMDAMYGAPPARALSGVRQANELGSTFGTKCIPLAELASWCSNRIAE